MSRVGFRLAAAGCLAGAVISAGSAGAATSPPPKDLLRSFVCQKALDPPARAVSVQAVMRPVTGTASMQMRFDLMRQSIPGGPFKLVRGRLLGSWTSPTDPTLGQRPGDVWIVNHPVVDLSAPATYRFRVHFRWTGSNGQQLGTAVQTSPACYQPELRADLFVRSVNVTALDSTHDAYTAVIANGGQTAAGPVEVDFAGAGASQPATIATVGPRSTAHRRFVAPACTPGTNITVTVDPSHTIDEYDFTNNALTIRCPAPSSSS
jgi:CARDB